MAARSWSRPREVRRVVRDGSAVPSRWVDLGRVPRAAVAGSSTPPGLGEVRPGRAQGSTLAELVRSWVDAHGAVDPHPRTIARLERDAVVDSRPDKIRGVDASELHDWWAAEARNIGYDPAPLVPERISTPETVGHDAEEDLIDEALVHAAEESASWLRADLARHLATILHSSGSPTGRASRRSTGPPHSLRRARRPRSRVDQRRAVPAPRLLRARPR